MLELLPLTWEIVVHGLSEVGKLILLVAIGVVSLEVLAYLVLVRWLKLKNALPFMLMLPALVGVAILILYPFGFNIYLAFSNMSMYRFKEFSVGLQYGISNLLDVFRVPVLQRVTFFQLFLRTFLWTAINVVFHVLGGLFLAILLNRPMKGKGIYRTLLIVPWAIPQVIAALAWKCEFHYINTGLSTFSWRSWDFSLFSGCLTPFGLSLL